jgi:hypothetical protein
MGSRVTTISIRTTIKSEDIKAILFALRNVLDVEETDFGYVLVLEEPVKMEDVESTIKALNSFAFVEDDGDIVTHKFTTRHLEAKTEVHRNIFDVLAGIKPTLKSCDDDVGCFAEATRTWSKVHHKIYDAVYGN